MTEALFAEPQRYEFFQAVRLHQRARPGAELGAGDDPRRETLRFSAEVSLAFPPSDIRSLVAGAGPETTDAPETPDTMEVRFMGVATPASFGSLPTPYAEAVLADLRAGHGAAKAFYDLFNHRLIALFYRAWAKYRPEIAYETAPAGRTTAFERAILALTGLGERAGAGSLPFDGRALVHRARALRRRGASAEGLAELVADYFGLPAAVHPYALRSYQLAEDERTRLGRQASRLGESCTLGARVELAQYAFRLSLGPLSAERFRDFLPTGAGHAALVALTRLAVGSDYDFSIELELAAGEAFTCRLGDRSTSDGRLGWSAWLASRAAVPAGRRVVLAAG